MKIIPRRLRRRKRPPSLNLSTWPHVVMINANFKLWQILKTHSQESTAKVAFDGCGGTGGDCLIFAEWHNRAAHSHNNTLSHLDIYGMDGGGGAERRRSKSAVYAIFYYIDWQGVEQISEFQEFGLEFVLLKKTQDGFGDLHCADWSSADGEWVNKWTGGFS